MDKKANKAIPFSCETDGESNSIADYFRAPEPVTSVPKTILEEPENDHVEESKDRDVEIVEINDDINTTQAQDTACYSSCILCKNGLFDCQSLLSYDVLHKNIPSVEKYEPIDLSSIEDVTREEIVAFDVRELVTPPTSPVLGKSSAEVYPKIPVADVSSIKPNFDLDFCALEQFFFEEELEFGENIQNPQKVNIYPNIVSSGKNSPSGKTKKLEEYCHNDITKVKQSFKPEKLNENEFHDEVELICETSNFSALKNELNREDLTPKFTQSMTEEILANDIECPSKPGMLMSPISPILYSQKKSKNSSQKCIRKLPKSSTPKVHRKNLFLIDNEVKSESKLKIKKGFNAENNDDRSFDDLEKQNEDILISNNLPPANIPVLNFNLGSYTQLLKNLENLDEDMSVRNVETGNKRDVPVSSNNMASDSSMCSVTQLLNLIDKTSTSTENITHVTLQRGTSPIIPNHKNKINSSEHVSSSVTSKQVSKKNSKEQLYYLDSDDDMFADVLLPTQKEHNLTMTENLKAKESVKTVHKSKNGSPPKDIVYHAHVDSKFSSNNTIIPGIEELPVSPLINKEKSSSTTVQQTTNLKSNSNAKSCTSQNLQERISGVAEDKCFMKDSLQEIHRPGDGNGVYSSSNNMAKISAKEKVTSSFLDTQFSPISVSKGNIHCNLPLSENLLDKTEKSPFKLKHKSDVTFMNNLNKKNAAVMNTSQKETSLPEDASNEYLRLGNMAHCSTPKKKNDLTSHFSFMSPIAVHPGVETTYKTSIIDNQLHEFSTKSRLSLKRKHKATSINDSKAVPWGRELDSDKSILSPRVKKAKLSSLDIASVDINQSQNKLLQTPEKSNHNSGKKLNAFIERKEYEERKKDISIIKEQLSCNKSCSTNTKDKDDSRYCGDQVSEEESPVLSNFTRKRTADIFSTSKYFNEKYITSFNKDDSLLLNNFQKKKSSDISIYSNSFMKDKIGSCKSYKTLMSQDGSPIIRPLAKKKTANISSTSDESTEDMRNCDTLKNNKLINHSLTSEENNNSRILLDKKVKNESEKNIKKSREIDGVIDLLSSDDSDFESQAAVKHKKMCEAKNSTHKEKTQQTKSKVKIISNNF